MTDQTVNCSKCGRPIVTQRQTDKGIESEFLDDQGRCFNCNKIGGKPMGRKKKNAETDERDPAVVKTQQQMNGDEPHANADEPSNRKAIGYEHPPAEVTDLLDDAMTRWHVELVEARVKVKPLFARAYDRHGDAIPAIKVRSHAVIAKIKITSLEDRVRGMGDATLLIDGSRWERMGHNARLAMLDHELEHLELIEDKLDDAGRPKLKMKHHDWECAGFDSVAKRQGENSIEAQNLAALRERFAQLLLPFPGDWRPIHAAREGEPVAATDKPAVGLLPK
jgi:hypothetical protein